MSRNDDEISDSELWREHRRAQQDRRAARLPIRTQAILALKGKGFTVKQLSEYQFRIDERLDLYPIHRRFHDIKTNTRGTYREPMDIAVRVLRTRIA